MRGENFLEESLLCPDGGIVKDVAEVKNFDNLAQNYRLGDIVQLDVSTRKGMYVFRL